MAKWDIDPDHSVAAFRVRHMMVTFVRGQFNRLKGTINYDENDPASLSLEFSLEINGLYTGIARRDEHLKSPDFFDAGAFPAIVFRSSGFTPGGDGGTLAGDLSIHGVTRPVSLDVVTAGPLKGPEGLGGEIVLGLTATAVVNREEFGMNWNVPMDGGGVMVGREIMIELNIEADLENA